MLSDEELLGFRIRLEELITSRECILAKARHKPECDMSVVLAHVEYDLYTLYRELEAHIKGTEANL